MNVGRTGSNNWWANAGGRNPGIGKWNMPLAARRAAGLTGGASQESNGTVSALQSTSQALTQALNAIRGIGNISNLRNSPMQARRPISGDTDIMAIRSFDPNRIMGIGREDFSVEVLQLAQAQRNEGEAFAATDLATESGFSVGEHHMAINIGNRQFDFRFTVSENDTTRDVQQRIADAINATRDEFASSNTVHFDVTASVTFDEQAGTSALVISSSQTGIDPRAGGGDSNFSVRSISGNAVETAGVDLATQRAQNSAFRVHRGDTQGALQTSRSNEVNLGFGVMAEFLDTGTVDVEMGRDTTTQQNAFRHMVNSFNYLVGAARNAGSRGSALASELGGIVRQFASQLESIGISLNAEGRMQIDEERMAAAAESGELEDFARSREGFNVLSRIGRTADNVSANPSGFADPQPDSGFGGMDGFEPGGFMGGGVNFTPMQSMQMTRFMNMSVLFDSLI
ncbi:MAG: hypothetical protein FWC20_03475 [Oscillospiraceae bacterium]|nr:hypothetical protein [Oscillospiraceae bacterium]MCL2278452.1 hypothetical protein [Oscillospiraceae bacterium]